MWMTLLACSPADPPAADPVIEVVAPAAAPAEPDLSEPEPEPDPDPAPDEPTPEPTPDAPPVEPPPLDTWTALMPTLPAPVQTVPCRDAPVEVVGPELQCVLTQDHTLSGHRMSRGASVRVWVDTGGLVELRFADLREPVEYLLIDGVPCLSTAALHPSGALNGCTLGRDAKVAGVALSKGMQVGLTHSGDVSRVITFDPVTVGGQTYGAGTLVFSGGKVVDHLPGAF